MYSFRVSDLGFVLVLLWLVSRIFRKRGAQTTALNGPPSPSFVSGWSTQIFASNDPGRLTETWAEEYGPAFIVPLSMGKKRLVLYDPQAVAHFYSKETYTYRLTPIARVAISGLLGKGLLWSDGEDHRRQRKILSPAFSPQSIKEITSVFFDSVYKTKDAWDAMFDNCADKSLVVDVQQWMNRISLDSIGIAGFDHDFNSLSGAPSEVATSFHALGQVKPSKYASFILPVVAPILPIVWNLPTKRNQAIGHMSSLIGRIGTQLLERSRRDASQNLKDQDRSLVGTLIRAEASQTTSTLTPTEVHAQMKTLIFAGYETSSISLTWILLELAAHPEKQARLREELVQFGADLTYDQLWSPTFAPYLDAVVKESLRLHAPLGETNRVCGADDVIPFSRPVTTASGERVNSITVGAGQLVHIPIAALNRSKMVWGPDALEFKPERWLDGEAGIPDLAKDMQGFHHILTFIDGPRTCLGRGFAVTEIKTVISVLLKNYSFAPRDGPSTKYGLQRSILPRPKIENEEGGVLPLRVQRVD